MTNVYTVSFINTQGRMITDWTTDLNKFLWAINYAGWKIAAVHKI